ncbi:class I SAM-dependent methyltransferase [Nitratireductor luteus]|uniref:class I SAM-dependent methyltransferase n=1 Tax=Nitratireductor luteus TaxID=2976980 RepID=UPI0022401F5A|nr:methyltransferase domain-containing protein [Nitratireductor luteus]
MDEFCLPDDYLARGEAHYFDDSPYFDSDIIHQPKVYDAADYFCRFARRSTIIDIGCGNGRKLQGVRADRKVGIDFGINIASCRDRYPAGVKWIEADLSKPECISLASHADNQSVVVCADVVEHLIDPRPLVALLAECYRNGAIVLTSTPDRIRVRGHDHRGPPPNQSHIREWAKDEYEQFLLHHGLPATFAGYTINNNQARELKTISTLHDRAVSGQANADTRAVAILSAMEEGDAVGFDQVKAPRATLLSWMSSLFRG